MSRWHPAVPLLTAAEMRAWDERAIRGMGVAEAVLMESAGRAAARLIHALHPRGRVVAAVGGGNNGGDALVVLRALRSWGREVAVILAPGVDPRRELLHGWELPVVDAGDQTEVSRYLDGADVVVDGLLGTGSSGAPRPPLAELIAAIAARDAPVVALDGPSGVDFTTGRIEGQAIRARETITFGGPKRGLLLHPGREHVGRLLVVEIGFPPLDEEGASAAVVTPAWARAHLPVRGAAAHKASVGKVAVVAGRGGMAGAAVMCAMGALRAGAGVVRVVTGEESRVVIQATIPEALFQRREDGERTREAVAGCDAMVLGPAMGTDDDSARLLHDLLRGSDLPAVLDADALTLVAGDPTLLPSGTAERWLLTPHPLEAARLLGCDTAEILRDPFGSAAEVAERFGCAVLLKGSPSLIAAPGQPTLVTVTGHSGVATGGMGDTLSGAAGALLGEGADPRTAGALALHFCGRAAEIAGRGRGLLPRDVAEALPDALLEAPEPRSPERPEVLLDLPSPR
jgi:ADP-dependent NAD(P)H-hydrate dehydratase / NAD(P)H-hydrate epimerase